MNRILTIIQDELSHFLELTHKADSDIQKQYYHFINRREKQFKAYVVFNRRFSQLINASHLSEEINTYPQPQVINQFKIELRERENLVSSIKELDAKLITWINTELTKLNQQLNNSKKEIQVLSKFKSGTSQSRGEKWDQTL